MLVAGIKKCLPLFRTITHAKLTEGEIGSLPEGTHIYESVGRMFVASTKSESTSH